MHARTAITRRGLLDPLQLTLVGHRLARSHEHIELRRLVAVGLDFGLVTAGLDPELRERAVEAVALADEVPIDEHLRVARLDLQSQGARLQHGLTIPPATAISVTAVPVTAVSVSSVVARSVAAVPERI